MEIKFHLPDFMRHCRLNLTMAEYMKRNPHKFREGVKIGSVYGSFPNMLWNGGRYFQGNCDPRIPGEVIKQFNQRGIPCRFTLTNPLLTPQHLSDPLCNAILKAADNGMNEAIVFSPMLEDYIREHFPDMPITSSTCKQIEDFDELCTEMEKDYSLVVLDYNLNNDFELLGKLPHKEKAELLINACCDPGCKRRGEHYRSIGRSQIALTEHMMKKTGTPYTPEPFECPCMRKTLYQTVDSPLHISPEAIYEKYVPMGFTNFKIEGRSVPDVNVLENYVYYLAKPEYKDEVRLDILIMLTGKFKYFG
ncbi:MAG: hypothetical protein ACI4J0_03845 [Huintestinicola sp.]|uniref:hypothetical protein n=1 Tax=Huintestinicola sp. TaxID=2981661 RepID=UPI003EFBDE16